MSQRDVARIDCPCCGHALELPLAAQLRANKKQVLCSCPRCGHEWSHAARLQASLHPIQPAIHPQEPIAAPHEHPAGTCVAPRSATAPVVWIIENDHTLRESLAYVARDAGFNTKTFPSAELMLECEHFSEPGCLLLDLNLPGMNAVELLSRVQLDQRWLSAIVLTARPDVPRVVQCLRAGAFDYFEIPVHPDRLVKRLREAVACSVEKNVRSNHHSSAET